NERQHAFRVLEAVLTDLGESHQLELARREEAPNLRAVLRAAAEKGDPKALNNLAWLLATCTVAEVRDGQSAVAYAQKAVSVTNRKDPETLDTLAAAYAEAGAFDKAVSAQQEAIALLQNDKTKTDFASRLK